MKQINRETAEILALQALAYILQDDKRTDSLIAQSGIMPENFKDAAIDPEMLGGILDFLLSDEQMVIEFCEEQGVPPEAPQMARLALPGATYL